MKFKFETIHRTRNALNAQQIYWEFFKLKKYFKIRHWSGEVKQPEIYFHRKQLPDVYRPFDMDAHIEKYQVVNKKYHYIAVIMLSYLIGFYGAKLLYDDQYNYYLSIRFPSHYYYYQQGYNFIEYHKNIIFNRLELEGKSLQGAVGYHNIKSGIYNLFKRKEQEIPYAMADESIKELDLFLKTQDKKAIDSVK